jgi:DNA-binding transcriptional LysR family regulator
MPMRAPETILPNITARELRAVCAIAEHGSFMAASLTLNMSQPALTRIVQRLERAVGVELFRRTTRRVEVSPAGEKFIAVAERILDDLRISLEGLQEIAGEQRGQVIVSAVMSVAYSRMPRIVAEYRASRPRIEIQMHEGVHGTVLESVRSGLSDLGITYIDKVPDEFSSIALGPEAFHVVLPKGHPLSGRKGVTLVQAADYAMVSLPRQAQTRHLLDSLASAAGLTLRHAVTVDQFATLMQCVDAGVGLAIVPGGAVPAALSAGLVSRPLIRPALRRHLGAVLLKGRGLTPSARGFLSHLQSSWATPSGSHPTRQGLRRRASMRWPQL